MDEIERDGVGWVYERLRCELLSCSLSPGSQIHEQVLAQRLGVSKSPVREALLRLQEQNLVEVQPRRGYRVKPISIRDAQDMYELRLLYERACVSRVIDCAEDSHIRLIEAAVHTSPPVDLRDWVSINRTFHTSLAKACGNSRLEHATIGLIEQFERFTCVSMMALGKPLRTKKFEEEHRALVQAIKSRDKRLAQSIIREHIETARKRTLQALADAVVVP